MLRNIIGFNLEIFSLRSNDTIYSFIELKLSYAIALILNSIVLLIVFSFIFFKDFIYLFSFFEKPLYNI